MDECPLCSEYSLHYDVYHNKAKCIHNGCGFSRRMSREQYLVEFADLSGYAISSKEREEITERKKALNK